MRIPVRDRMARDKTTFFRCHAGQDDAEYFLQNAADKISDDGMGLIYSSEYQNGMGLVHSLEGSGTGHATVR